MVKYIFMFLMKIIKMIMIANIIFNLYYDEINTSWLFFIKLLIFSLNN